LLVSNTNPNNVPIKKNSTKSIKIINYKDDIKTNLLMQLEEIKDNPFIQDNEIEKMNEKIKDIIHVNLNDSEDPKNENLSKIYLFKFIKFIFKGIPKITWRICNI
jgi:hypothetical protein